MHSPRDLPCLPQSACGEMSEVSKLWKHRPARLWTGGGTLSSPPPKSRGPWERSCWIVMMDRHPPPIVGNLSYQRHGSRAVAKSRSQRIRGKEVHGAHGGLSVYFLLIRTCTGHYNMGGYLHYTVLCLGCFQGPTITHRGKWICSVKLLWEAVASEVERVSECPCPSRIHRSSSGMDMMWCTM